MEVRGKITSGVMAGEPIIKKFFPRIVAILGFAPFLGTLDIKLEKPVELQLYSTKAIEHVLMDGRKMVDAYLAPVVLHAGGELYNCWAIRLAGDDPYGKDTLGILSHASIREKFSLRDGDDVTVTLFEQKPEKERGRFLKRLYGREHQLMKS